MNKWLLSIQQGVIYTILIFSSLFFINNNSLFAQGNINVETISVPGTSANCNEPIIAQLEVRNLGSVDVAAVDWELQVYFFDSAFNTVFQETIPSTVLPIGSTVSFQTSGSFTPEETGNYSVYVEAYYSGDTDDNDNTKDKSFSVDCTPPTDPDLIIQNISVPGEIVVCNTSFKPKFTVCNISSIDAQTNDWYADVSLLKDNSHVSTIRVNGNFIGSGSSQNPTCAIFETESAFTIEETGSYKIFVRVFDYVGDDLSLDHKEKPFTADCTPQPDLELSEISVPDQTAECNTAFIPKFTVCNKGSAVAQASEWNVDVTIKNGNDSLLFSETVSGKLVDPEFCSVLETTGSFTPVASGTYTIALNVNYSGDINTTNNSSTKEFTVTCITLPPDLAVQSITVPGDSTDCNAFKPKFVISNLGGVDVEASEWSVTVTIRDNINSSVFSEIVSGVDLSAEASVTLETSNSFSWINWEKNYTIIVTVEYSSDDNLENDSKTKEFVIDCNLDLKVQSISVPRETMECNSPFLPIFTICNVNNSDAQANDWTVDVLIWKIGSLSTYEETIQGVFLEKGSEQNPTCKTFEIDVPFTPSTTGTYNIGIEVNWPFDYNSDNNTLSQAFYVNCPDRLDLELKTISVPDQTANCNTAFKPKFEVCNLGTVSTQASEWNVDVEIKNSSDSSVFKETVNGKLLDAEACSSLETVGSFTPSISGNYTTSFKINYTGDEYLTNNTQTKEFTVTCPPDLAVQSITVPSSTISFTTALNLKPKFEICNVGGLDAIDTEWDVTVTIKDALNNTTFSEIVSGTNLLSGNCVTLETSNLFTLVESGTYTIFIDVSYSHDENSENNLITKEFTVSPAIPVDLVVNWILVPDQTVECNSFKPKFEICNFGDLNVEASDWNVDVIIKKGDNVIFSFSETVAGVLIEGLKCVTLETSGSFSPISAFIGGEGDYTTTVTINYSEDADVEDNVLSKEFTVTNCPKPDLELFSISVPGQTADCNGFVPEFEVCNKGNVDATADEWEVEVLIYQARLYGIIIDTVALLTVPGVDLEAGYCATLETNTEVELIPSDSGTFTIKLRAYYLLDLLDSYEVDYNNNSLEHEFEVDCASLVDRIDNNIPDEYKLHQNYPNPFNPATQIEFDVLEEAQVKLFVYNVLGQVVATLVDDVKSAGSYRVNFDATNLPTGVYIYRIEMGSYQETMKMLLTK